MYIFHVALTRLCVSSCPHQVLSDIGLAAKIDFDNIDKAPEEKARGITIATAHGKFRIRSPTTAAMFALANFLESRIFLFTTEAKAPSSVLCFSAS